MIDKIAQVGVPLGNRLEGIGNIGLQGGGQPVPVLASVISSTIGFLTIIAAIYFMFVLITGAISIIGAGGDKVAYENARRKLYTGVVGLVVVIAAMFIMDLITGILGISDILDIGQMIDRIRL